mgnify:CR=1 FL=1
MKSFFATHMDMLQRLKAWGFPVAEQTQVVQEMIIMLEVVAVVLIVLVIQVQAVLVAVEFVATITPPMRAVARAAIKKQLSLWVALVSNTRSWLANVASHETPQVVSAAVVQVVEMAVERFAPRLYTTLGVFLPLWNLGQAAGAGR